LVAALISYLAGFLSDKWGRRNILLAALLIFFITYVGFAFTRSITLIAVLFAGYGLYQGIFRSVGKALATDFVPDRLLASGIARSRHPPRRSQAVMV
jgi:MFS family permease